MFLCWAGREVGGAQVSNGGSQHSKSARTTNAASACVPCEMALGANGGRHPDRATFHQAATGVGRMQPLLLWPPFGCLFVLFVVF